MPLAYPRALGPGVREVVGDDELVEVGVDEGVALLRPASAGRDILVLHQRPPDTTAVLDEADRLGWLAGRAGAPAVVASGRADEGDEAVVVRLPAGAVRGGRGHPLGPERLVESVAGFLRRLHDLDVERCPLETPLGELVELARDRVDAGTIATAATGPYAGRPVDELLATLDRMVAELGEGDRRVFVHAGLRADRWWFVPDGEPVVIGWRRAGVGDPHLDLAAAAALVVELHGPALVAPLLDAYGLDRVDVRRLDACQLLVHLLG